MFSLLWLPFGLLLGLIRMITPRRTYYRSSCGRSDDVAPSTHLKALLVVTSPLWVVGGLLTVLILAVKFVEWLVSVWHRGPWFAALLIVCGVAVLGGLVVRWRYRRGAELRVELGMVTRVGNFYPCCGLPDGSTHATTCRSKGLPPENPAQWSDRR